MTFPGGTHVLVGAVFGERDVRLSSTHLPSATAKKGQQSLDICLEVDSCLTRSRFHSFSFGEKDTKDILYIYIC